MDAPDVVGVGGTFCIRFVLHLLHTANNNKTKKQQYVSSVMFRRLSTPLVATLAAARRFTPADDLKKLYASDFETQQYPCDIVPSDATLFAKFLFKASESKNAFDAVLKDFEAISAAAPKLPVFWERNEQVSQIAEFKALNPATLFTMIWMQENGMLSDLNQVRDAFETYVNAARKKVVAKILVGDAKADTTDAKKVAQELLKENKQLSSYTL
ncbi:MAG: hypothetical protein Q8J97_11790, partial [Flavobacteriaceae bacterium]|nr:hypothetical protein [Flavobacteriaceae bacterium]